MKNSKADAYAAAGVDITAGYEAVRLMKEHVARTVTDGVISEVGGFGRSFQTGALRHQRPCAGKRHRRSRYKA